MATQQHGSTHSAKFTNYVHNRGTSERITPLQWLIENNQIRIVHKGMSDLCTLSHSFRKAPNFLVHNVGKPHKLQHAFGLNLRFISGQSVKSSKGRNKLKRSHPIVHVLIFRNVANTSIGCRIFPRICSKQSYFTLGRLEFTHQEFEQC